MISNEDFQFISKFNNANPEERMGLLREQQGKMQV